MTLVEEANKLSFGFVFPLGKPLQQTKKFRATLYLLSSSNFIMLENRQILNETVEEYIKSAFKDHELIEINCKPLGKSKLWCIIKTTPTKEEMKYKDLTIRKKSKRVTIEKSLLKIEEYLVKSDLPYITFHYIISLD